MNNNIQTESTLLNNWRIRLTIGVILFIGTVNTLAGLGAVLTNADFFTEREIDALTLVFGLILVTSGGALLTLVRQGRLQVALVPLFVALPIMVIVGFIGGSSSADLNVDLSVGLVVRSTFAVVLLQSVPLFWQQAPQVAL